MAKADILNKIQNFVRTQMSLNTDSIILTEKSGGIKINDLFIRNSTDYWIVSDQLNINLTKMRSRRMAVLYAVAYLKKKHGLIQQIHAFDTILYGLKHDKKIYEQKISNNFKRYLFEDRHSRTVYELEILYKQITVLEKSVGLQ